MFRGEYGYADLILMTDPYVELIRIRILLFYSVVNKKKERKKVFFLTFLLISYRKYIE